MRREQIITLLHNDKQAFSDSSGKYLRVPPEETYMTQDRAQVLVTFSVNDKRSTARYDLLKKKGLWKIISVVYNEPFTLHSFVDGKRYVDQLAKTIPYSLTPKTFTLQAQDFITIDRTLVIVPTEETIQSEKKETEVSVEFQNPSSGYTVVLYGGIHPLEVEFISKQGSRVNSRRGFLPDDLEENGWGMIAVYPENTDIDRYKDGIVPGALVQIPLRVEH